MKRIIYGVSVVTSIVLISWYAVDKTQIFHQKMDSSIKTDVPAATQFNLTIIKIPTVSSTVTIEYSKDAKRIGEWKTTGREAVINGGYFESDYTPSGFLVVSGKRVGDRTFDQDKSGLIQIKNGTISIRDLKKQPIQNNEKFDYALQSYPFLIKNSEPAIERDGDKYAARSALGLDKNGNVYMVTTNLIQPTLYQFMREIILTGIPFTNVLNLDGGPSSGLYDNWDGGVEHLYDNQTPVPSIIRLKFTY